MRVWIVNQYAVPPDQPGGLRPFALAKELALSGHDVTLVLGSFNHWTRRESRLKEGQDELEEFIDGVRFVWIRVPPYPGSTVRRFFSMVAFARRVATSAILANLEPPDAVVGSNPHLFAALAAERQAERNGAGFVFEVRDIWPQSLIDYGRLSPSHPAILVMSAIERHLVRRAGAVLTLLPDSKKYFVEKGADPDGVMWLPNGVYLPDLPPVRELPQRDEFTVVFAGIHGVANGLDTVLDAAQILTEAGMANRIRFRFVGDGGEKDRLVKRATEMGLTNVEFRPSVPKAKVSDEIAEADAGLMILKSSPVFRWGVSPNKLFDYFGAGRPVVYSVEASNNPVRDAEAGITVVPEDARSLAEGVLRLSEAPFEERRQMGLNGRRYVEEHHDLAKLGRVLEAAVKRAAERAQ
ncbi:MAG: glycosyltransferase family 4 protein [Fimbriimonadaceae bacterium]|nr:glycosyltransferase family 4 protein [Fimbriimonadaceae bacterium]QYK56094.1 MAG: glycosyltransferase family 4 protein [Fimbriimonadaceae bacterium]